MIDLHIHVLPEVDDGAQSLTVSRAMLTRLAANGCTRIVATPHLMEPLTDAYGALVEAALEEVRPIADEFGIAVEAGYEHMLTPGLVGRLESGEPSTLGGSRSVLVELPFVGWPQHAESSLFALQVAGYVPVLAHPERYHAVQQDLDLALAVADRGVVLQLSAGSFVGAFGRSAEKTARALLVEALEQGHLVVLASDAHSDGERLQSVADGLAWIRKRVPDGDAVVRWAFEAMPTALLADRAISLPHLEISAHGDAGDQTSPRSRSQASTGRRWWRFGK